MQDVCANMNTHHMPDRLRMMFLFGVSLLFTHELDAMTHAEWRVLPLISLLGPELGRLAFVSFHVPLFAFVMGWLTSHVPGRAIKAQFWVAMFLVLHAGLHLAFSGHPAYTYAGILSNTLIFGSAICGASYLWFSGKLRAQEMSPR